jgi:hypothetical protein
MDEFGKKGDQKWLDQQYAAWSSGKSVDPLLASHFNSTSAAKKEITATEAMINNINAEADKEFGTIDKYIPAGSPNIIVKGPNSNVVYTPKDFVDFNSKIKNYVSIYSGGSTGGGYGGITYKDAKAKEKIDPPAPNPIIERWKVKRKRDGKRNGMAVVNTTKITFTKKGEKLQPKSIRVIKEGDVFSGYQYAKLFNGQYTLWALQSDPNATATEWAYQGPGDEVELIL